MWFTKFLSSNILYILWFALYFTFTWILFGANVASFIITTIVYGGSVGIALSPLGEVLLRLVENCREPQTDVERSYLLPLFEEVYENAMEVTPSLNKGIKIYIMDAMYVNAFAIGRQTVAVTKGALETFTEDELKGILAHELGHMNYGHTKALLLSVIGNLFFNIFIWVLRLVFKIFQTIANIVSYFNWIALIFSFFIFITRLCVDILTFLFINLSQIILASNSRSNEIEADRYAYDIGYGRELTNGLYLLQKMDIQAEVSIMDKAKASHPHLAYRIGQLEMLEDIDLGA